MTEWQPIETAPIDGTSVIVYCPVDYDGEFDVTAIVRFAGASSQPWRVEDGRNIPPLWGIATHWMPLPAPPSE